MVVGSLFIMTKETILLTKKRYRERHKEQIAQYNKKYYQKNREKLLVSSKEHYKEDYALNPQKYIDRWSKYRKAHRKVIRKRQTEYTKKYPIKVKLRKEKYYQENKDKWKNNTKRLRLRFKILQRDNFTCQYCGRKAPEVILEVDHIYPKSKGGLNKKENYRTACKDCNIGKGDAILTN